MCAEFVEEELRWLVLNVGCGCEKEEVGQRKKLEIAEPLLRLENYWTHGLAS
jgi:hypothetical protein